MTNLSLNSRYKFFVRAPKRLRILSKSSQSQVLPKIAYYQILSAKTIKNDQEIPTLLLKAQKRTHFMREQDQRNKSILAIVYLMTRKLFVILLYTKSSGKQYC